MAEDIHRVTVDRLAGGYVVEGFYLGAGDSWGTPWPLRFKQVCADANALKDVMDKWASSWEPATPESEVSA